MVYDINGFLIQITSQRLREPVTMGSFLTLFCLFFLFFPLFPNFQVNHITHACAVKKNRKMVLTALNPIKITLTRVVMDEKHFLPDVYLIITTLQLVINALDTIVGSLWSHHIVSVYSPHGAQIKTNKIFFFRPQNINFQQYPYICIYFQKDKDTRDMLIIILW